MAIDVRNRIPAEIFDYQTLTDALKGLSSPRDKITDMLRQGIIIRVKKGLYVFGDKDRKYPYSKELPANLIYGPSYVSLDYALAYYGLIPERVEEFAGCYRSLRLRRLGGYLRRLQRSKKVIPDE